MTQIKSRNTVKKICGIVGNRTPRSGDVTQPSTLLR
jgi:hypothetical protein